MNKYRIAPLIFTISIVFMVLFTGCSRQTNKGAPEKDKKKPPAGNHTGAMERVVKVDTVTTEVKHIQLVKQYIGEIKPFYSVDMRSYMSGWITSINVDTGDSVHKNDTICVIEHEEIQAQAAQAEANISVAKATVARAEAELEKVVLETRRTESLYEKGYISKRELEQAQTAEKQARASLNSAKGQLAQAESQLKNIMVKLRDATIKAPFTGVVAERYVDPGAYVSPSNSIVRLVDDTKVKAVVNVVEEDFPHIRGGAASTIMSDSYPGQKFEGKVIRISPAIDKVSRTAVVEILLPNKDGKLRTGMTARVNLVVLENPAALVIPESALRRDVESGREFVFTVINGKAARCDVKTGIISASEVEIVEGLNLNDIVITGNIRISDGMKVELLRQEGGSM